MGFLLESPVQLADSQGPYLSTPKGALHFGGILGGDCLEFSDTLYNAV